MKVDGTHFRSVWLADDGQSVEIIDQTKLPKSFKILRLSTPKDVARAIRKMKVRGAPLIGVTAAYGLAMAMHENASDKAIARTAEALLATRPTAVNLRWALERMRDALRDEPLESRATRAYAEAATMADEDVEMCEQIGLVGLRVLREIWEETPTRQPLQVLTHCNAGWLATVDWGTALAPIYCCHDAGIPIHVWVDETRPRNQGYLTAWELTQHGVPNTVIADNTGGLLMREGKVDACLVGTDRTTRTGDIANKIGTYLKAAAARDCNVPFYVALPSPSIDWSITDGAKIPIEERDPKEIHSYAAFAAYNPGFDVTPARLVTGLITERGLCAASEGGLLSLFPERAGSAVS